MDGSYYIRIYNRMEEGHLVVYVCLKQPYGLFLV